MENYFFETSEKQESKKLYLLVIYDIIDNKRRLKFAKAMEGYGIRVQQSCFEAFLSEAVFRKLLQDIPRYIDKKADSVRVYRIIGNGEVTLFGQNIKPRAEDVIIV